jgi:imidazole glycerol phosphate synthase subunit HisF
MEPVKIMPCLDRKAGRVVKGINVAVAVMMVASEPVSRFVPADR